MRMNLPARPQRGQSLESRTESENFAALMEHQRSVLFPPVQVLENTKDESETEPEE